MIYDNQGSTWCLLPRIANPVLHNHHQCVRKYFYLFILLHNNSFFDSWLFSSCLLQPTCFIVNLLLHPCQCNQKLHTNVIPKWTITLSHIFWNLSSFFVQDLNIFWVDLCVAYTVVPLFKSEQLDFTFILGGSLQIWPEKFTFYLSYCFCLCLSEMVTSKDSIEL